MKHMRKMKGMAIAVLCMFMWTSTVCAAPSQVYSIQVSDEYGQIKQRYKGTSPKTIIHIQDAHSNLDAQKNIAHIINELVSRDQAAVVGVEGAVGEVDLDTFRSFPIEQARDAVSLDYMQKGLFSAAEYARITASDNFDLFGIEDDALFTSNFRMFYQASQKREDISQVINNIENILDSLKEIVYGEQLRVFDQAAIRYETGVDSIMVFMPTLYDAIASCGIEVTDYLQLAQFYEVLKVQNRMDPNRAQQEKQQLLESISAFRDIKDVTTFSEREQCLYLTNEAVNSGIGLKQYPNFRLLTQYHTAYQSIDFSALVQEVEKVAYSARLKTAQTDDAKELVTFCKRLDVLKNVCLLEAQRGQAAYFYKHMDEFSYKSFYDYIHTQSVMHNVSSYFNADNPAFDEVVQLAGRFYGEAARRDTAMLDNMIKHMDATGTDTAVLISGGFHSDGMTRLMKKQNINFLTITPNVTSLDATIPYMDKMTGKLFDLAPELVSYIQGLVSQIASPEFMTGMQHDFVETAMTATFQLLIQGALNSLSIEEVSSKLSKHFNSNFDKQFVATACENLRKELVSHFGEAVLRTYGAAISNILTSDADVDGYVLPDDVKAKIDAYRSQFTTSLAEALNAHVSGIVAQQEQEVLTQEAEKPGTEKSWIRKARLIGGLAFAFLAGINSLSATAQSAEKQLPAADGKVLTVNATDTANHSDAYQYDGWDPDKDNDTVQQTFGTSQTFAIGATVISGNDTANAFHVDNVQEVTLGDTGVEVPVNVYEISQVVDDVLITSFAVELSDQKDAFRGGGMSASHALQAIFRAGAANQDLGEKVLKALGLTIVDGSTQDWSDSFLATVFPGNTKVWDYVPESLKNLDADYFNTPSFTGTQFNDRVNSVGCIAINFENKDRIAEKMELIEPRAARVPTAELDTELDLHRDVKLTTTTKTKSFNVSAGSKTISTATGADRDPQVFMLNAYADYIKARLLGDFGSYTEKGRDFLSYDNLKEMANTFSQDKSKKIANLLATMDEGAIKNISRDLGINLSDTEDIRNEIAKELNWQFENILQNNDFTDGMSNKSLATLGLLSDLYANHGVRDILDSVGDQLVNNAYLDGNTVGTSAEIGDATLSIQDVKIVGETVTKVDGKQTKKVSWEVSGAATKGFEYKAEMDVSAHADGTGNLANGTQDFLDDITDIWTKTIDDDIVNPQTSDNPAQVLDPVSGYTAADNDRDDMFDTVEDAADDTADLWNETTGVGADGQGEADVRAMAKAHLNALRVYDGRGKITIEKEGHKTVQVEVFGGIGTSQGVYADESASTDIAGSGFINKDGNSINGGFSISGEGMLRHEFSFKNFEGFFGGLRAKQGNTEVSAGVTRGTNVEELTSRDNIDLGYSLDYNADDGLLNIAIEGSIDAQFDKEAKTGSFSFQDQLDVHGFIEESAGRLQDQPFYGRLDQLFTDFNAQAADATMQPSDVLNTFFDNVWSNIQTKFEGDSFGNAGDVVDALAKLLRDNAFQDDLEQIETWLKANPQFMDDWHAFKDFLKDEAGNLGNELDGIRDRLDQAIDDGVDGVKKPAYENYQSTKATVQVTDQRDISLPGTGVLDETTLVGTGRVRGDVLYKNGSMDDINIDAGITGRAISGVFDNTVLASASFDASFNQGVKIADAIAGVNLDRTSFDACLKEIDLIRANKHMYSTRIGQLEAVKDQLRLIQQKHGGVTTVSALAAYLNTRNESGELFALPTRFMEDWNQSLMGRIGVGSSDYSAQYTAEVLFGEQGKVKPILVQDVTFVTPLAYASVLLDREFSIVGVQGAIKINGREGKSTVNVQVKNSGANMLGTDITNFNVKLNLNISELGSIKTRLFPGRNGNLAKSWISTVDTLYEVNDEQKLQNAGVSRMYEVTRDTIADQAANNATLQPIKEFFDENQEFNGVIKVLTGDSTSFSRGDTMATSFISEDTNTQTIVMHHNLLNTAAEENRQDSLKVVLQHECNDLRRMEMDDGEDAHENDIDEGDMDRVRELYLLNSVRGQNQALAQIISNMLDADALSVTDSTKKLTLVCDGSQYETFMKAFGRMLTSLPAPVRTQLSQMVTIKVANASTELQNMFKDEKFAGLPIQPLTTRLEDVLSDIENPDEAMIITTSEEQTDKEKEMFVRFKNFITLNPVGYKDFWGFLALVQQLSAKLNGKEELSNFVDMKGVNGRNIFELSQGVMSQVFEQVQVAARESFVQMSA